MIGNVTLSRKKTHDACRSARLHQIYVVALGMFILNTHTSTTHHTHTNARRHTNVQHTRTRTHESTHKHKHTRTHTPHTHTRARERKHPDRSEHTTNNLKQPTIQHARKQTQTFTDTHTHTHTHTQRNQSPSRSKHTIKNLTPNDPAHTRTHTHTHTRALHSATPIDRHTLHTRPHRTPRTSVFTCACENEQNSLTCMTIVCE